MCHFKDLRLYSELWETRSRQFLSVKEGRNVSFLFVCFCLPGTRSLHYIEPEVRMYWSSCFSVASDTVTHLDLAWVITRSYPGETAVYINIKGHNTKL